MNGVSQTARATRSYYPMGQSAQRYPSPDYRAGSFITTGQYRSTDPRMFGPVYPSLRMRIATAWSRGLNGLADTNWLAALAGIYQAYQANAQSAAADDAAVDYLREQVYTALQDIRFAVRHGGVSPGQALSAGQQVINAYYAQTASFPRAATRQRAESYRAQFNTDAALNQSEAEWFYQKWDCPDITTQAQIGTPRCIQLSAAATTGGGSASPTTGTATPAVGGIPAAGNTPPVAVSDGTGDILGLLGSVNLLGMSIPILPVAVIGLIFLIKK